MLWLVRMLWPITEKNWTVVNVGTNVMAPTYLVETEDGWGGRGLYQQGKSQGNFGQFDIKLDYNYCQISTNCFELSSSLAVQKLPPRLEQLKVKRKHFFENLRRSPDKSLGIALKPPATKVLVLTPRSRELSSRLSTSLLEEPLLLNFSSILSDRKSSSQGEVNI